MKEHKYTQCILCEGATFQEAVDKFNREMQKHADFNPTYERAGESFLIYIKLTKFEPETVTETKHLEGCVNHCRECSHCVREKTRFGEIDARKKYGYCDLNGMIKIRIDQIVCDEFYTENLERKEG